MTAEKPKWYSNLKKWREENGATGELWDTYVTVTKEKLAQYAYCYFALGTITGVILTLSYNYLRS